MAGRKKKETQENNEPKFNALDSGVLPDVARPFDPIEDLNLPEFSTSSTLTTESVSNRDSNGFLKGVEYKFTEDGLIDWKAMIPDEFIGLNKETFKKKGIDIYKISEEKFKELKAAASDREKTLMLGAIKWLLNVRGYSKIEINSKPCENRAVCDVQITWIPNKESGWKEIVTGGTGTYLFNPNDKMNFCIDSLAENRAVSRAVRNFLRIPTVSVEELSQDGSVGTLEEEIVNKYGPPTPHSSLIDIAKKHDYSFDKVKERALVLDEKKKKDNPEFTYESDKHNPNTWKVWEDIPPQRCLEFIGLLKKKENKE